MTNKRRAAERALVSSPLGASLPLWCMFMAHHLEPITLPLCRSAALSHLSRQCVKTKRGAATVWTSLEKCCFPQGVLQIHPEKVSRLLTIQLFGKLIVFCFFLCEMCHEWKVGFATWSNVCRNFLRFVIPKLSSVSDTDLCRVHKPRRAIS